MGRFLEIEKSRQACYKSVSPYFSESTRVAGLYRKKTRPFCLPIECAEQNLFPEIRETAISHFSKHAIKWHDGQNRRPSNHLCDSQVCCVNFLLPFANQPRALAQILRPLFSELDYMLPVEDGQYNTDFRRVTSPDLEKLGESATDIWLKLVNPAGRFISTSTERLFGELSAEQLPEMKSWLEYIYSRYSWVHNTKE